MSCGMWLLESGPALRICPLERCVREASWQRNSFRGTRLDGGNDFLTGSILGGTMQVADPDLDPDLDLAVGVMGMVTVTT